VDIHSGLGEGTLFEPTSFHSRGEERQRVRALQSGSEEAFNELIAEYTPLVYRLSYRLLRDPADAPDALQEVFLKVFRNIEQFQGECSLKTWLYRIAVNTISNQNRWWRRHRGPELPLDSEECISSEDGLLATDNRDNPFETLLCRETQEIVRRAMGRLAAPYRTVLVLKEMEGLDYEEMAAVLHLPMGTVKSRLARARRSLKQELEWMMEPALRGVPQWSPAK